MQSRQLAATALMGLVLLGIYLAAAQLGLLLRSDFGGLTPLWPASGLAVAIMARLGVGWWPLIVLGEFITAWSLGQPWSMGLAGGAAQALEALTALWLLDRTGTREWTRSVNSTVHFCLVVSLVPPLIAASIGTVAQLVHGLVPPGGWPLALFTWWLGDAMGILIAAPLVMTWWRWPFGSRREALEWLGIAVLMSLSGAVLVWMPDAQGDLLYFLLLPFVAWLSLNFRGVGASSSVAILAAFVFGVSGGTDDPFRTAVYIGFVGAAAYMGHLIAAALTRQKRLVDELRFRADFDPVTRVFNRSRLESELRRITDRRTSRGSGALIYLDLDHFKIVNDSCGHETGDRLLRDLAERLAGILPEGVMFARLGGDEFGLLVPGDSGVSADDLAERLRREVLDYQFVHSEYRFTLGTSIGIAHFEAGEPASAVLSRADIACYAAKDAGGDRVHVYRSGDLAMQRHQSELEWVSGFQQAMSRGELQLFGQRILPLAGGSQDPPFYEVLLRKRENGKAVSPARFLPVADRYGLMPAIDRWVMTECFRLVSDTSGPGVRLSINLAAATMDRPRFQQRVLELADRFDVDPGRICFEVTETIAIRNLTRAVETMQGLREQGFRFALDDFGSGVASFGYLNRLPVQYVKVDGQFVRDVHENRGSRIIVSSLNDIARYRGIACVAECVESEAALQELRAIGVDFAQGFHLHRPQSLDGLVRGEEAARESR